MRPEGSPREPKPDITLLRGFHGLPGSDNHHHGEELRMELFNSVGSLTPFVLKKLGAPPAPAQETRP